jgi:hypothetical protein
MPQKKGLAGFSTTFVRAKLQLIDIKEERRLDRTGGFDNDFRTGTPYFPYPRSIQVPFIVYAVEGTDYYHGQSHIPIDTGVTHSSYTRLGDILGFSDISSIFADFHVEGGFKYQPEAENGNTI